VGEIKILFLGEIVGKSGVWCLKELLPKIKERHKIDFVIADGEGATGGFGLGKNHSIYIHKLGVDCITLGECAYYKKDMVEHLMHAPYVLRPANYPLKNPGRGWMVYEAAGRRIAVVILLGQAGFKRVHLKNPYTTLPKILEHIGPQVNTVIVDFHAFTTAEKNTMFYFMDGKVSAIIGTHTKAITSDERVLPGGTAVITDVGRTGSIESVGGLDPEIEIRKLTTQIHEYSKEAWGKLEAQGVVITLGEDGKAAGIQRIRETITAPASAAAQELASP
jgi:metallophosphoesterase (TIGR00282 family)